MAYRWHCGFESSPGNNQNMTTTNTDFDVISASSVPRYSTALVRTGVFSGFPNGSVGFARKVLDDQQTWIIGIGWLTPLTGNYSVIGLYDSDDSDYQCNLISSSDGSLSLYRGNSNLLGTTDTGLIGVNTYYYIELKYTIDSSAGSYEVKLANTSVLSGSGANTQNTTNAYADGIQLWYCGNTAANAATRIDDVYICDGTGGSKNDFLGDISCVPLYPIGAGNYTDFTPSAGSNWQNVDDTTADGDSTYNSDDTPTDMDSYDITAVTSSPTIFAARCNFVVRKDDAGSRQVRAFCRSNGTDYPGDTEDVLDSYVYFNHIYETDPDTSTDWTQTTINAAEFGLEVVT